MSGKVKEEPLNSYTDILIEFFELAIYHILHIRELYPQFSFARKKHYGIPVLVSIHPGVRKYIYNILSTAKELMKRNELKKLSLNVINDNSRVIERHFIHLARFNDPLKTDDIYFTQLESSLRSMYLKQSLSLGNLPPLPEGCRFSIHIHTTEMGTSLLEDESKPQDFPFVMVPDEDRQMSLPGLLPISTVRVDNARMALYTLCEKN